MRRAGAGLRCRAVGDRGQVPDGPVRNPRRSLAGSLVMAGVRDEGARAEPEGDAVPFAFAGAGWRLLLKPGGHGGYSYWLGSPDVELWVGRHPKMKGPAARMQFHSLYLHGMGVEAALSAVRDLLAG